MKADYFAVTNISDLNISDSPKMSLLAPLLAARRNGVVVPLSSNLSSAAEISTNLRDLYQSVGYYPEFLALVGSAGAIPLETITDPAWTSDKIVSDIIYSEADDDLFPDIAIGRIVTNNVLEGTLFVSRTSTYDLLFDGKWEKSFTEVGSWSKEMIAPMLRNYGFNDSVKWVNKNISDYPEIESSIIVHYGHSNEVFMGHAFGINSTNVLAPGLVISKGCQVAGIDVQANHSSIVKHLFKLGSVGFVGGPRTVTAAGGQIDLAFVNKILDGEPMGKAFQHGIKSITLTLMNKKNGLIERERSNIMLLGDPALTINVPDDPDITPADLTINDNIVEITIPGPWVFPLDSLVTTEWKYNGVLNLATIPGVEVTTYWGNGGYNHQDHYFMAGFETTGNVSSVTQNETFSAPLGMTGSFYEDFHQDGSKTILWHVRVLDFNQTTSVINDSIDYVTYSIDYL
jgi:hypothetical protein